MSTPFRGRYSPASRGGSSAAGGRGAPSGRGAGRGSSGPYRGGRGGAGGHAEGRGGFARGRGDGGFARGGGFSRGGGHDREPPAKKESILDMGQYMDREIYVKFNGGREVTGVLKGYDPLLNMVLDNAQEKMRNADGEIKARALGLAVIRGTHITTLHPVDGSESISNPYLAAAADEADGPAYQYTPKADEESD